MRNSVLVLMILGLGLLATACNSEEKQTADSDEVVAEQRVRPAASGGTTAAYFTYTNSLSEPDTLLGVAGEISALTQVHETYETEDGMMGMREKKDIAVQPGETLMFKQGGLHVMFIQLEKELAEGDSVALTLQFSKAGEIQLMLSVKH